MYRHCECSEAICPGGLGVPDLADDNDELQSRLENIIRRVWKAKGMPASLDRWLTEFFADELWQAAVNGYGNSLDDFDFDTPDYIMLRKLQEDVWNFSAAKNYAQLRALTDALVDDNGQLRSFSQFRKAAYEVNDMHVKTWLRAEYNLAVVSSQAAAKWVQIEQDKDIMPLLYFSAILDDGTTEICRNFNGITLPWDHPFWDQYYIPNHYGERSDILQKADGRITDVSTIVFPEKIPEIFKTNLGKQKRVFPPDHPYYTGMPESMKEQGFNFLHGK